MRSSRRSTRPLWGALAALLFVATASAHDVQPPGGLTLRSGGQDYFYVVDTFGCEATITATSLNPTLVKVYAVNMGNPMFLLPGGGTSATVPNRVDQTFLVRAEPNILGNPMAVIQVCWVGVTAPNPPCPENNCSPPLSPHFLTIQIDSDSQSFGSESLCGIVGDPVTSDDGELIVDEPADIAIGGPLPLYFRRHYGSQLSSDADQASRLGPGWLSNFDWRLATTGNNVEVYTPTGRVLRFERGFQQTAWQLAVYLDEPYQLVDSGLDRVLIDPRTGLRRTFDSMGRMTAVADGKGNAHTLTHSGANLNQVSDGLGRTLTMGYTANLLTSVSDGTRTVSFAYTSGVLTSATNADNETTTYAYDPAHLPHPLMTARTRPEGNMPWTQTYDGSRRVDSQSDAQAHTTTLAFDTAPGETTITNPLGDGVQHTHNAKSELTRIEDEGGTAAPLTYNTSGQRTAVTDRLGRTTSWTLHAPTGQLATVKEANGAMTSYGYTARSAGGGTVYDLTSITRADATTEAFGYDAQGNLTTWTDAAGNDWTYTFNARGQVLTETNPAGGTTTYTYNADGTIATAMDHAGNVTTFAYDALRRLQTITRPDTTTVSYTYDAVDRVLSVTNELSQTTAFTWDDNGNLVAITDAESHTWNFVYDAMDRLESATDPVGNTASVTFDELGRLASVANGAGDALTLGYDLRGRLVSITDAMTNAWSSSYDAESVGTRASDPLSNATNVTNDALGRPTAITGPLGGSVLYAYDSMGRVSQVRDERGFTSHAHYDARGLLESTVLPIAGGTTHIEHDELGNVTHVDHPGGADSSFDHDPQGRLTMTTDPAGRQTTYTYDDRNRVDQFALPAGLGTVDVTWDDADRLTGVSYPDGTNLAYSYDANGQLISATNLSLGYDDAGRIMSSNGVLIGRDQAGRVDSVELAPGKLVTYQYDSRGLLTSITDWLGGVTTFGYDTAARLTSIARPNGITTTYEYDAEGHVTRIAETDVSPLPSALGPGPVPVAEVTVEYDLSGAMRRLVENYPLQAEPDLGTVTRSYADDGSVISWNYDELGSVVHHDDFWGNQDSIWMNWDYAERPQQIRIEAQLVTVTQHDDLGYLTSRTIGGVVESYRRNYALGGAISVIARNGVDATYNVHNPAGGLVYSIDAVTNESSYYHYNIALSTAFLTNGAGAVTDSWAYAPFGAELARTGTSQNLFTYRGYQGAVREHRALYHIDRRIYDACGGLYYNRPVVKFSIHTLDANSYAYERGNPYEQIADADALAPYPRFAAAETGPTTAANVVSASTSLLVPFAVRDLGFDTGIALRNTTADPLGPAVPNAGSTTLHYVQQRQRSPLGGLASGTASNGALTAGATWTVLLSELLSAATGNSRSGSSAAPPVTDTSNPAPANAAAAVAKFRKKFPPGKLTPGAVTRSVGQFWFFDADNIELVTKVLNSSVINDRYWVFASGLTDVSVRTAVTAGGSNVTSRQGNVPMLGGIPVIGHLFRRTGSAPNSRLQVLITPSIVDAAERLEQ